jgi:hypothetical protein
MDADPANKCVMYFLTVNWKNKMNWQDSSLVMKKTTGSGLFIMPEVLPV